MILSHQHKFIFMHSRKTAGSSISVSLNKYLGPKDLQLGAWPESIRAGGKYNDLSLSIAARKPHKLILESIKYSLKNRVVAASPFYINKALKKHMMDKHAFKLGAHVSAEQIRNFDEYSWDNYFKFCFVRNPWTHAVSDYHWRLNAIKGQDVTGITFKEFLKRLDDPTLPDPEGVRPPIITNWSIYTINDKVALDFIGKYESLDDDLRKVSAKLDLQVDIGTVQAKGSVRPKSKSTRDYYDDESIELVRKIYKNEIECFSYQVPF